MRTAGSSSTIPVVGDTLRPRKRSGGIVWFWSEPPQDARAAIEALVPRGFRFAMGWTARALEIGTADDIALLVLKARGWGGVREAIRDFVEAANEIHPIAMYVGGAATCELADWPGGEDILHKLLQNVLDAPLTGERARAAWTLDVAGIDADSRWAPVIARTLGESFDDDCGLVSSLRRSGRESALTPHSKREVLAILLLRGTALPPRGDVAAAARKRLRLLEGASSAVTTEWLRRASSTLLRTTIIPATASSIARWCLNRDFPEVLAESLFNCLVTTDPRLALDLARGWVSKEPNSEMARAGFLNAAIVVGELTVQAAQIRWAVANRAKDANLVLNVLYLLNEAQDFVRAGRVASNYLEGPRILEDDRLQNNLMNAFTGAVLPAKEDAIAARIEARQHKTALHHAILASYYARRQRDEDSASACIAAVEAGYPPAALAADTDLRGITSLPMVAARLRGALK